MRMSIEIDENLMSEVLGATGLKSQREAVELGLRTLLKLTLQESRQFRGASSPSRLGLADLLAEMPGGTSDEDWEVLR